MATTGFTQRKFRKESAPNPAGKKAPGIDANIGPTRARKTAKTNTKKPHIPAKKRVL